MIKTSPAVFAVGNTYQIMVEVEHESLMSVKIGGRVYYDETNGIMNSLSRVHRVTVPIKALDNARKYTVCIRPIVKRKPYFTETEDELEYEFDFHPVPNDNIRAYHISDAHNRIAEPVAAARAFGEIDFLILNGDVIDHSGDVEKFSNIYKICSEITGGSKPVIFSRGNHDMRGNFAEKFADYTPSQYRNTFYTFCIGSVWGIILDCGEDKPDTNPEYGYTVACHVFRERQSEYIRNVIENSKNEYERDDVKTKVIIAHNPFTMQLDPPFNIEADIYSEWASLLREYIKPDLMICGHTHKHGINHVGGENDHLGQPCPLVIASEPQSERFIGCGFVISQTDIKVAFTDSNGCTLSEEIITK